MSTNCKSKFISGKLRWRTALYLCFCHPVAPSSGWCQRQTEWRCWVMRHSRSGSRPPRSRTSRWRHYHRCLHRDTRWYLQHNMSWRVTFFVRVESRLLSKWNHVCSYSRVTFVITFCSSLSTVWIIPCAWLQNTAYPNLCTFKCMYMHMCMYMYS